MMKLILSLTLIWALSSTAGALQCQNCTNLDCSSTGSVTCTTETMCATVTVQVPVSGNPVNVIGKGCAPSSTCPTDGTQTTSVNLGSGSTITSAKCCSTDNCNTDVLTIPAQTNNSLQCFTCNANGTDCSKQLQCTGVQDRCFKGNFTVGNITVPLFGCVSANVCDRLSDLQSVIQDFATGNFTSGPSCCSSNLCNTVLTTSDACCFRMGVLHLLLGLLIFTLF